MTARVLSGYPRVRDLPGTDVETVDDVVYDLGYQATALHRWVWRVRPPSGRIILALSEDSTTLVRVRAGLVTDGASIPILAQLVMGDRALYRLAAYLHDLLAQLGAPRAASDRAFHAVAIVGDHHVGPVRAWLGWAGVRVGGWKAWRRWARLRDQRETV